MTSKDMTLKELYAKLKTLTEELGIQIDKIENKEIKNAAVVGRKHAQEIKKLCPQIRVELQKRKVELDIKKKGKKKKK